MGSVCDVFAPFPPGLEIFFYFIFFLPLVPSVIFDTDLSANFLAFRVLSSLFLGIAGIGHKALHSLCYGWSVGMVGCCARNWTSTFCVSFTTRRRTAGYRGFDPPLSDPSCARSHCLGATPSSLSVCFWLRCFTSGPPGWFAWLHPASGLCASLRHVLVFGLRGWAWACLFGAVPVPGRAGSARLISRVMCLLQEVPT